MHIFIIISLVIVLCSYWLLPFLVIAISGYYRLLLFADLSAPPFRALLVATAVAVATGYFPAVSFFPG